MTLHPYGSYVPSEGGHMTLDVRKGLNTEEALCHMGAADAVLTVRSGMRFLRKWLPYKCCKRPCGKAQDMCVFRISASDHKSVCKYAPPRFPHQQDEGAA